jgi:hypothetical protein
MHGDYRINLVLFVNNLNIFMVNAILEFKKIYTLILMLSLILERIVRQIMFQMGEFLTNILEILCYYSHIVVNIQCAYP